MIGAVFQSCLFRPLVQSLNFGWDVSSGGLSSHQVPIRFLSARGIHTAAFLWGPSFFFSFISVVSSWVVALMLASPWPPSFCLRVLYLEFSSLRRYRVYIWVLPSPPTASLLYQQGIWLSHLLCQSGWSITTVTVSLVISPVRPVFPSAGFFIASCPTVQCWSPDWFPIFDPVRSWSACSIPVPVLVFCLTLLWALSHPHWFLRNVFLWYWKLPLNPNSGKQMLFDKVLHQFPPSRLCRCWCLWSRPYSAEFLALSGGICLWDPKVLVAVLDVSKVPIR